MLSLYTQGGSVMTKIRKSIRKLEARFDKTAEAFVFHHSNLAFLAMFIGIPVIVLVVVCIATTIIAFPITWIMDWL